MWLWRVRLRQPNGPPREPLTADAELIRAVAATHARLDELRRQISELGEDWEKRDRELAERISSLINLSANAAGPVRRITGDIGDDARRGV